MQVSWIDPEEIKALAQQLLDPQPNKLGHPADVAPLVEAANPSLIDDEAEEGTFSRAPDHSPELEQIRAKLRSIRDRAKDAGLLPSAPAVAPAPVFAPAPPFAPSPAPAIPQPETLPKVEAPPPPTADSPSRFQPNAGPIADRLTSLANWAIQETKSDEFLVLDHHGDILWGIPSREDLVVQTMLLINSAANSGTPIEHALRTTTSSEKQLIVLRCPTRYGRVTISLLAPYSPNEETLANVRESLTLAINEATIG